MKLSATGQVIDQFNTTNFNNPVTFLGFKAGCFSIKNNFAQETVSLIEGIFA
jgi:hypothetical protein